jgi:ABC-2 type transport system permease protein
MKEKNLMARRNDEAGSVTPERRSKLYWAINDTLTMIGRTLRHITRNLESLLLGFILPIIVLLMFVYVFGGAIDTGDMAYINYVVPGVIILAAGYGAARTAESVSLDLSVGLIDRFRTLPIQSASVLTGHVVTSVVRNLLSTGLVIATALLIGFHPIADPLAWLAALGILLLTILAISWLGVIVGLTARSVEGASAFSFFLLFTPYISSAFVRAETMPNVLQFIAENQPYTHVIETIRALTTGSPIGRHGWLALAWTGSITAVSYAVAVSLFKRKANR